MHIFSKFITKLFLSVSLIGTVIQLEAQEENEVLLPISNQGDTYSGPGVDWILSQTDSVQFVLFGEQHYVAGVAEFVTFIYEHLQDQDFNYLVLETDGWTTQQSAKMGVFPFSQKNPHSIAFDSNGDLNLMQAAIDSNPEIASPIWGVDQMQTAIHPYYRLTEIANTAKQRRLARGAFLKASLKMGRYTRQNHQKDIVTLENVFEENISPEKDQIFRELKLTIEIFSKWMDPATRQESVTIRERLMDQNFDNYLSEVPDAKAVFKMGGAHTMYGIGPNGILTFGDHVNKVAKAKGQSVLSISLSRFNPDRSLVSESDFGENQMILIDTKTALASQYADSSKLIQKDAIIYLKDAGYAPKNVNWGFEQVFKRNLIFSIAPLGLGLIGCVVMLLTSLTAIITKKKYRNTKMLLSLAGSFLMLMIVGFQIFQILKFPAYDSAIDSGTLPLLIYALFSIGSLLYGYYAWITLRSNSIKLISKIGYLLFALMFFVCSYSIYYWNLAGMLK